MQCVGALQLMQFLCTLWNRPKVYWVHRNMLFTNSLLPHRSAIISTKLSCQESVWMFLHSQFGFKVQCFSLSIECVFVWVWKWNKVTLEWHTFQGIALHWGPLSGMHAHCITSCSLVHIKLFWLGICLFISLSASAALNQICLSDSTFKGTFNYFSTMVVFGLHNHSKVWGCFFMCRQQWQRT